MFNLHSPQNHSTRSFTNCKQTRLIAVFFKMSIITKSAGRVPTSTNAKLLKNLLIYCGTELLTAYTECQYQLQAWIEVTWCHLTNNNVVWLLFTFLPCCMECKQSSHEKAVRLSNVCTVTKRKFCPDLYIIWKNAYPSFPTQRTVSYTHLTLPTILRV